MRQRRNVLNVLFKHVAYNRMAKVRKKKMFPFNNCGCCWNTARAAARNTCSGMQVDLGFTAVFPQLLRSKHGWNSGIYSLSYTQCSKASLRTTVSFPLSETQDFWHLCWTMLSRSALSVGQIASAIHRFCNVWVFLNPCIPQHCFSFQPNQLPKGIWMCYRDKTKQSFFNLFLKLIGASIFI